MPHLRERRAQDEARRDHALRRQALGFGNRLLHAQPHLAEPRDVVARIGGRAQRMSHRERVHQLHIRAVELIQREAVILVRFALDELRELPAHELRRDALVARRARSVELRKLGKASSRELHSRMAPGARLRREAALERRLLGAGEIARRGGAVRIAAHPFVGELAEEIRERTLRRERRRGGEREQ